MSSLFKALDYLLRLMRKLIRSSLGTETKAENIWVVVLALGCVLYVSFRQRPDAPGEAGEASAPRADFWQQQLPREEGLGELEALLRMPHLRVSSTAADHGSLYSLARIKKPWSVEHRIAKPGSLSSDDGFLPDSPHHPAQELCVMSALRVRFLKWQDEVFLGFYSLEEAWRISRLSPLYLIAVDRIHAYPSCAMGRVLYNPHL